MKRSEMVAKIIDIVWLECYDDLELSKEEASGILARLEAEGMLPPKYNCIKTIKEWEVDNRYQDGGLELEKQIAVSKHEWEKEDE
jgi:hypothetical protein